MNHSPRFWARLDEVCSGKAKALRKEMRGYNTSFVQQVEKIFSMNEEQHNKIIEEAYKVVDIYSIDKFYNNIMRVYNRAIRKHW